MALYVGFENTPKVTAALKKQPEKVEKILVSAINRGADTALSSSKYPSITKSIANRYTIPQSDLRGKHLKDEAKRKIGVLKVVRASKSRIYATIHVPDRHLSITHFKISPKVPRPENPPKNGYRFEILRGHPVTLSRGFLTYSHNSIQYFQRLGTSRYPVKRIVGPSVPQMLTKPAADSITKSTQTIIDQRIGHEMERVLGVKKV